MISSFKSSFCFQFTVRIILVFHFDGLSELSCLLHPVKEDKHAVYFLSPQRTVGQRLWVCVFERQEVSSWQRVCRQEAAVGVRLHHVDRGLQDNLRGHSHMTGEDVRLWPEQSFQEIAIAALWHPPCWSVIIHSSFVCMFSHGSINI